MVKSDGNMKNTLIKETFSAANIHPDIFQYIMAIEESAVIKPVHRFPESYFNRILQLIANAAQTEQEWLDPDL